MVKFVTKASLGYKSKSILYLFQNLVRFKGRAILQKIATWLFCLVGIVVMFVWNWKLSLATSTGVIIMLLVYLAPTWNWGVYLRKWRRFFTGSQRQFTLAVGSGSISAFVAYVLAAIWAESESHWLAVGVILQGVGTIFTVVLLLWQIIRHRVNRDAEQFDQLVTDLANLDPLKRLIAVRQLNRLVSHPRASQADIHQVVEYFRFMLSVESDPFIRDAILDSLQMWDNQQLAPQSNQPLQMPIYNQEKIF